MPARLSALLVGALAACFAPDPPAGGEDARVDSSTALLESSPAEHAPVQPDERPVVVFLGTSLTAGLGLSRDEDTYVAKVAELAEAAGTPIRAVNAGVSGETSAGGLRRLDWVLREPLDVLVLELGANDGLRGQDPGALAANLTDIIRRTRARYPDAEVVIAGMEAPPNLGPRYTLAFHSVFPTVAEQEHAALIPFILEDVAGIPELNQADGIHPTAEGHAIMAAHVWKQLGPVIQRLEAAAPAGATH